MPLQLHHNLKKKEKKLIKRFKMERIASTKLTTQSTDMYTKQIGTCANTNARFTLT
jgi:hypothetical protein